MDEFDVSNALNECGKFFFLLSKVNTEYILSRGGHRKKPRHWVGGGGWLRSLNKVFGTEKF